MAIVTSPLMSIDAVGQFGSSIVFSHWNGKHIAKRYVPENKSNTVNQQTIRSYFLTSVQAWNALTTQQKTDWTTFAHSHYGADYSGIDAIIRYGVKYLIEHTGVEPSSWTTPTAP